MIEVKHRDIIFSGNPVRDARLRSLTGQSLSKGRIYILNSIQSWLYDRLDGRQNSLPYLLTP